MLSSPNQLTKLPAAAALQKLLSGEALRHYHIVGKLDLMAASDDEFLQPITIENCWLDELKGSMLRYERPVSLHASHFVEAVFFAAYFRQGLTIADCVFEGSVDFQAGGHNQPGYSVCLLRNTFQGFVNFFDCWYEAEVQVKGNVFRAGTNLLGTPMGIPVSFEVPPRIAANTGSLHCNNEEGTEPENNR